MKFAETHEWITVEDEVGIVGISQHAAKELGEIVHVELPQVGKQFEMGEEIVLIESTKAATDLHTPVSGKVVSVNEKVAKNPALITKDPEGKGWLFKIHVDNPNNINTLLDKKAYLELIKGK